MIAQAVASIRAALDQGDLDAAQEAFGQAIRSPAGVVDDVAFGKLLLALGDSVHIPDDTILWGPGVRVWANPFRDDYAWRCGVCPWTGSNYRTERGARGAAERHAAEHPGVVAKAAHGPCETP